MNGFMWCELVSTASTHSVRDKSSLASLLRLYAVRGPSEQRTPKWRKKPDQDDFRQHAVGAVLRVDLKLPLPPWRGGHRIGGERDKMGGHCRTLRSRSGIGF